MLQNIKFVEKILKCLKADILKQYWDFPGGPPVKKPPSNAREPWSGDEDLACHGETKPMCTATKESPHTTAKTQHKKINKKQNSIQSVQFSSVAQSCPTLCDPMNCSTLGLPVHHRILEFTQTPVHRVSDAIPAISSSVIPFSSCPQSLPASKSFPMSQLFAWGGQSTGVSALASVLPKNTQGWSPSEWTGWISLQSKGLSRVFSNTTVQMHQYFGAQFSSQSNSSIYTWLLEKP